MYHLQAAPVKNDGISTSPWSTAVDSPRTKKRLRTSSSSGVMEHGQGKSWSISASQPTSSVDKSTTSGMNSAPYAPGDNQYMTEILRLKGIIRSRDRKADIDNETISELQTEVNEMASTLRQKELSLHQDVIKATMRAVQGLKTSDKGVQCCPHDMSAAYRRTFEYGIPWIKMKNGVYMVDWATVEAERVGNHPEDPAVPKLTTWVRSYDHRPGDMAPPSQVASMHFQHEPVQQRGGRGGRPTRGGRPGYRSSRRGSR
jgi:hypothetical protein